MPRFEQPDGTEVFVRDVPDESQGKFSAVRARVMQKKGPPPGLTERQRLERGAKKVFGEIWDYVTGDGDDLERLRRKLQEEDDG